MKKKIIMIMCFVFLISAICPAPAVYAAHKKPWYLSIEECLWSSGQYVWHQVLVTYEGDPTFVSDKIVQMGIRADGTHYYIVDEGYWEWQEKPICSKVL